MNELSYLVLIAATLTATAGACTPKQVVVDGKPMTEEEGAAHVYAGAREALEAGDTPTAKARLKEVVDRFPGAARVADALADLGGIMLEEGGCPAARHYYERVITDFSDTPHAKTALDALKKCEGGAPAEGPISPLEARFMQAADDTSRRSIASEAADAALASQDFGSAVRWLLRVRGLEQDDAKKSAIEVRIVELVDTRVSFQEVRSLYEEARGSGFPADVLAFKLGRIQYHVRDYANAKDTLEKCLSTWPTSRYAEGAKHLLALMDARSKVNPIKVGVLAPTSGKLKAYGENVLQAVRLAMGELDEDAKKKEAPPPIDLVIRDTQGDPVETAKQVEELVLTDGAIAIVGAMFTVEAEAAAYRAQELGVPLLTVSAADDITGIGPYVFRAGLTRQAEMEALVEYVMDVLGMKRFAILYPRHPYGESLIDIFWDRVETRQGEVRGVESYAAEDTTFTGPVRRLVGRASLDVRGDYYKALQECDKQPDSYRRARCKRELSTTLRPIIDFDGLFIPDYPRTLALIAPALAFEDIIVETDARRLDKIEKTLGRKVRPVTLLGASGWNSPTLPEKAERYVENAIFTDGFFAEAEDKATIEFVTKFRKQFNRTPSLPEALFFDAINMVKAAIAEQKPATRNEMREAFRRIHDFPGVTGKTSFKDGQDAKKEVHILTIKDGRIKEAPPPSEKAPVPAATPETDPELDE